MEYLKTLRIRTCFKIVSLSVHKIWNKKWSVYFGFLWLACLAEEQNCTKMQKCSFLVIEGFSSRWTVLLQQSWKMMKSNYLKLSCWDKVTWQSSVEILTWTRLYVGLVPASFIYVYVKEPGMTWNTCAVPQHPDFSRWGDYWSLPPKLFCLWWSKNLGVDRQTNGVSWLWCWLWCLFYHQWYYRLDCFLRTSFSSSSYVSCYSLLIPLD